jgi:hypothetical protein
MGWQTRRTNIAGNYSQSISAGQGMLGAYSSSNANLTASWEPARMWIIGGTAQYGQMSNVTPLSESSGSGGHTILGTAFVRRRIAENLSVDVEYSRIHQIYSGIAVIENAPDGNRIAVNVNYRFSKPLGR